MSDERQNEMIVKGLDNVPQRFDEALRGILAPFLKGVQERAELQRYLTQRDQNDPNALSGLCDSDTPVAKVQQTEHPE